SVVVSRRDSRIGCRLHIGLDIGLLREFTPLGVLECLLHPIRGWSDVKRSSMLQSGVSTGKTLKTGQLFQGDVELDHSALCLETRDSFEKTLVESSVSAKL